jgi:hypothetical protein
VPKHQGNIVGIPQVKHAVVHVRDRVRASGRGATRGGVDGAAAGCACASPRLQLLARVLDPAQATLVVSASFDDIGVVCAMRDVGRGAWEACPRVVGILMHRA